MIHKCSIYTQVQNVPVTSESQKVYLKTNKRQPWQIPTQNKNFLKSILLSEFFQLLTEG